jgi:outer membrane immunogenic protein
MKKILLSTVALVSLSAGALAADLPSRRMAPAPYVAAVPVFTWTGFYAGVNAGYGWTDRNNNDSLSFAPGTFGGGTGAGTITFSDRGNRADGVLGGGQIGYMWQFGAGTGFVAGVEADIQAIDLRRNDDRFGAGGCTFSAGCFTSTGPVPAGFVALRDDVSNLDWFGTVRGNLGWSFGNVMVYGTGGFAYGDGNRRNDCPSTIGNTFVGNLCGSNNDNTRTGYTVGGGIKWAMPTMTGLFGSSAVIFGVEGLYVNLDDNNRNNSGLVGFRSNGTPVFDSTLVRRKDEMDFALVRAKIDFKF